jgi:hypothetical protein
MNRDEAYRLGRKCVTSELWQWIPGMVAMDDTGVPFTVPHSGMESDTTAAPDLRSIITQRMAFAMLKRRLPTLEVRWYHESGWRVSDGVAGKDGGMLSPIVADTLPSLLSSIFWHWPR